jgi:hypothetical protein
MLSVVVHLANKPSGIVLAFLWISLVAFAAGAVAAFMVKAFYAAAIAVGLAFFVASFMVT